MNNRSYSNSHPDNASKNQDRAQNGEGAIIIPPLQSDLGLKLKIAKENDIQINGKP